MTTPCWALGGICINVNLCIGFRFLTEIPGCKNRMNVCCFSWNKYKVKDFSDQGIGSLSLPWSLKQEIGGKGVLEVEPPMTNDDGKGKRGGKKKGIGVQFLKAPENGIDSKTQVLITPFNKIGSGHGPIVIGYNNN